MLSEVAVNKAVSFIGDFVKMRYFFVDYKLKKDGMIFTSYVEARDEHYANCAIRKALPDSSDWVPYSIDEIPRDYWYFNEDGDLLFNRETQNGDQ